MGLNSTLSLQNGEQNLAPLLNHLIFRGPYDPQKWSLPDSIIYYITKNPSSSKAYQKLIECCKYFFIKNPIMVSKILYFNCSHKKWEISLYGFKKYLKFENSMNTKFWITDCLDNYVMQSPSDRISSITPYLYQVDVTILKLSDQIISINEFVFLSSNVENIVLYVNTIKDENGAAVSLEKIVECLPKIKNFQLIDSFILTISKNSVAELLKLPHFSNIDTFKLMNISEEFDVETLIIKQLKFFLTIHFPSEAYKNQLEAISDEILSSDDRDYAPPIITFNELAEEKQNKINTLYREYYLK